MKRRQSVLLEEIDIAPSGAPLALAEKRFRKTLDGLNGNRLLTNLFLKYNGVLANTGGGSTDGSAVTSGHLNFLRAVKVRSDKADVVLINDIDGLSLHRINAFDAGTREDHTANTAANDAAFDAFFRLMFALGKPNDDVLRDLDTAVDMLRQSLTVEVLFGLFTDLVSGSDRTTKTVDAGLLEVFAEVINAPAEDFKGYSYDAAGNITDPGDLPLYYRNLEFLAKEDISQASTSKKIKIPFNDRIYRRIYIAQRSSADLSERTDIITPTQRVGLNVQNFPWFQKQRWGDLCSENKGAYHLETKVASWNVLDFARTGKISDQLSVLTKESGNAELEVEVTGGLSNAQLWVIGDSLKPLPEAVRR